MSSGQPRVSLKAYTKGKGETDEAVLSAGRAVAVGADPVYAALAELWAAGIAAFIGDIETADDWVTKVDGEAEQRCFAVRRQMDVFRAQLDVLRGDLSHGDKRLQSLRFDFDTAGDRWMVNNIDAFYAAMPARIASGEAEASTTQALRNPGFVMRHGLRAARKGRDRLTRMIETTEYPFFTGSLAFELAKLEYSQGRTSQAHAHAHAERVQELLAAYPESTLRRQATELIAEYATKH